MNGWKNGWMEGFLVFYNKHRCTDAQIKSLKATFQPGSRQKKKQTPKKLSRIENPAGIHPQGLDLGTPDIY